MNELKNAVAVVTGAANGIGRAVTEALAGEGARVLMVDRDGAEATKVARKLGRQKRTVRVFEADVAAAATAARAAEIARSE